MLESGWQFLAVSKNSENNERGNNYCPAEFAAILHYCRDDFGVH